MIGNIVRYISLIVLPVISIGLCAALAYSIVKLIDTFKKND